MNDSHDHATAGPTARRVLAGAQERGHPGDASLARGHNAVSVIVRDGSTGDRFEPGVEPAADGLDTFEYPYACAVWLGVASTIGSPTSETRRDLRTASPACNDAQETVVRPPAHTLGHV